MTDAERTEHDDERAERVEYTEDEKRAIRWGSALARVGQSDLAKLGHQNSRRGHQRAVALLVGLANHDGEIRVSTLRDILRTLNAYNQANFAQDMTKDSTDSERGRGPEDGLWTNDTYRGYRRGISGSWKLTERGKKLAAEYAAIVDRGVAEVQASVSRTFSIKARAISCPYCREKVAAEDRAVCSSKCGSEAHATCLDEFGASCGSCNWGGHNGAGTPGCATCNGKGTIPSTRCALARTTVRCNGSYTIIATPVTPVGKSEEV